MNLLKLFVVFSFVCSNVFAASRPARLLSVIEDDAKKSICFTNLTGGTVNIAGAVIRHGSCTIFTNCENPEVTSVQEQFGLSHTGWEAVYLTDAQMWAIFLNNASCITTDDMITSPHAITPGGGLISPGGDILTSPTAGGQTCSNCRGGMRRSPSCHDIARDCISVNG